jgi:hypothetical protein
MAGGARPWTLRVWTSQVLTPQVLTPQVLTPQVLAHGARSLSPSWAARTLCGAGSAKG